MVRSFIVDKVLRGTPFVSFQFSATWSATIEILRLITVYHLSDKVAKLTPVLALVTSPLPQPLSFHCALGPKHDSQRAVSQWHLLLCLLASDSARFDVVLASLSELDWHWVWGWRLSLGGGVSGKENWGRWRRGNCAPQSLKTGDKYTWAPWPDSALGITKI